MPDLEKVILWFIRKFVSSNRSRSTFHLLCYGFTANPGESPYHLEGAYACKQNHRQWRIQGAQNFLNFMQFSEILLKIIRWRPPLEGWRPLLRKSWIRP